MVKLITDKGPGAAGPDQVENLGDLAREAASMDASAQAAANGASQAQQQAQAQQQQQQTSAAVEQLAAVLCVVRDIAVELAHELDKLPKPISLGIWTDERMRSLAMPLNAIAQEHQEVVEAFFAKWGPLLMLGASLTMPTVATIKAVRAYKPLPTTAREVPAGEGAAGG